MVAENVLLKQEVHDLDKMRYPSITFCYTYKHGSKHASTNYLPYFYEKAEQEGRQMVLQEISPSPSPND